MADEWFKIIVNLATIVAWLIGIGLSVAAVAKGKKLKAEMGVSLATYLFLVAVTEVVYTVGALMILSAMGLNIAQHLAALEFGAIFTKVSELDMTTVKIVGVIGWIGFVLNRGISFLSPLYLLIAGGKKLHPYFRASAQLEIGLEIVTTALIFWCLFMK